MTETPESSSPKVCPITLEPIEPQSLFSHAGISFDIFALYAYLTQSTNWLNPVSRVPFTLEDLQALESKVKELCGEDAISFADSESDTGGEEPFAGPEGLDLGSIEEEDVELQLRVLSPIDERIRLHVGLNVPFNTPESSEADPDEDDAFDVADISGNDLPPRRCYPSVVSMFNDAKRTNKMKADLDLLQYLHYDSLDVLNQMIALLSDDHFHQMVWEQTSPTVFGVINRLVETRPDQTADVNVEVTFSDCWEAYRVHVVRALNRRYAEVIQDMRRVDSSEADLCLRSHISDVENNGGIPPERKSWLVDSLKDLLR